MSDIQELIDAASTATTPPPPEQPMEVVVEQAAPAEADPEAVAVAEKKPPTPQRPAPAADKDTLIASYTGQGSSGYSLMSYICAGKMVHVKETEVIVKLSDYKYAVYSRKNAPESVYDTTADLVAQGMKIKYVSKATTHELQERLKALRKKEVPLTLKLYACNRQGVPVTPNDVSTKACWYYVTASISTDVVGTIFVKRSQSNKKALIMYYGEGERHSILTAAAALRINSKGVAVVRTDCKGHVELAFPTKKRFMAYWVGRDDLPKDLSATCHVMVNRNSVYLSMDSETSPGKYYVVVGMRKKFARSRRSKAVDSKTVASKTVEAVRKTAKKAVRKTVKRTAAVTVKPAADADAADAAADDAVDTTVKPAAADATAMRPAAPEKPENALKTAATVKPAAETAEKPAAAVKPVAAATEKPVAAATVKPAAAAVKTPATAATVKPAAVKAREAADDTTKMQKKRVAVVADSSDDEVEQPKRQRRSSLPPPEECLGDMSGYSEDDTEDENDYIMAELYAADSSDSD